MILSTYHPSNSSAPLTISKVSSDSFDNCIPVRTTINSFNDHLISSETQQLVCDLFETIIYNEERIRHLRDTLISHEDFDPINLFQSLTKSQISNNNLTRNALAAYLQRPQHDLKLLFPGIKQFTVLSFVRSIFTIPTEDDDQVTNFFT